MMSAPQRRQLPWGSQFFSYSLELAVPYDLPWFYQADFIRHRDETVHQSGLVPNFVLTWDLSCEFLWVFSY